MKVTFDIAKTPKVVELLQGKIPQEDTVGTPIDDAVITMVDAVEAAEEGIINWESIMSACREGKISSTVVEECWKHFPVDDRLDNLFAQARDAAYMTELKEKSIHQYNTVLRACAS
ncbi:MAG: hypothetical protein HYY52_07810 [Candidatus Melainabacteria bacterium]|nr:hypothetical protein [Candidatus Melainabacteria bacterium]